MFWTPLMPQASAVSRSCINGRTFHTDSSDKDSPFQDGVIARILARLPARSQSPYDRFMPRSLRPVRAACEHAPGGWEPAPKAPNGARSDSLGSVPLKDIEV